MRVAGQDGDKDLDAEARHAERKGNGVQGDGGCWGAQCVLPLMKSDTFGLNEGSMARRAGGGELFIQRRTSQLRDMDAAGEGKCVHQTRENIPV